MTCVIRKHRFNYGRANRRQGTATTEVDRAVGWQASPLADRLAKSAGKMRLKGTIALVDDAGNECLCFINWARDGLPKVVRPGSSRTTRDMLVKTRKTGPAS
jgi:hypothetical protein